MGNVEVVLLTEVDKEVDEPVVDILIARTRRRTMAIEDEITTRGHFNPTAGQDIDFISLNINPSFRNLGCNISAVRSINRFLKCHVVAALSKSG